MEAARARYLASARGREALDSLDPVLGSLDPVQLSTQLRRSFEPAEASALAEQLTLRQRALKNHGPSPLPLLYSTSGLEMMTHPVVAQRRATRLAIIGERVLDLTCGLGGDLGAAVAAGLAATGLERDGAIALLAAANVPGAALVRGVAESTPVRFGQASLIIDPSRRDGRGRRFDPAAFSPDWDVAMALAASARAAVVKAPPGLDHAYIPPSAEFEVVQLGRSLRESALWFGDAAVPGLRRAVKLPQGAELDSRAPEASPVAAPLGPVVYDPHSCVTRAGLVRHLAHRLGARLLDPQLAYLTAAEAIEDRLAEPFEVLAAMPFSLARLRQWLRAQAMRPVDIRRRAFPIEPDELRRLLGRLDGEPVTLLCTTLARERTVIVCSPLAVDPLATVRPPETV